MPSSQVYNCNTNQSEHLLIPHKKPTAAFLSNSPAVQTNLSYVSFLDISASIISYYLPNSRYVHRCLSSFKSAYFVNIINPILSLLIYCTTNNIIYYTVLVYYYFFLIIIFNYYPTLSLLIRTRFTYPDTFNWSSVIYLY